MSGKLDIKSLPPAKISHLTTYEKARNKKEKLICLAYSQVLKIKKIGINDDFFNLGGNSILAIELSSILHHSFKIHVSDIYEYKTPKKLAEHLNLSTNNIETNLKKIKRDFSNTNRTSHLYQNLNVKISNYLSSIVKQDHQFSFKKITNVLLTGATGYLGCNILRQLLLNTNYNVFLLVRSDSIENAHQTMSRKYRFYFDEDLDLLYNARIFIFKSDLEDSLLGISSDEYHQLSRSVDSIIHCAALTKHYGNYNEFYSANVQATINLLELSKQTAQKDFHFISTISTLDNNCTAGNDVTLFIEDDIIDTLDKQSNIYIKTKHEAEKVIMQYKKYGIISNIYRVGNLAYISDNFRVQETVEDNAFFSRMKCLVTLNIAAKELGVEEISPVDLTALAIVKIMDKNELSNQIHHVFNPNVCNVVEFLSKLNPKPIQIIPISDFLDTLADYLYKPNMHHPMIMHFLLHQNWLDGANKLHIINFVLQNRTNATLEKLGFKWPEITQNIFDEFIKHTYPNK